MSSKKKTLRFEDLLAELEEIVGQLEGGQIGLDEALAKYEKGIAALKQCHEILKAAEKKIEILAKNPDGALETRPFEGEREGGSEGEEKKKKRRAPQISPAEDAAEEKGKTLF